MGVLITMQRSSASPPIRPHTGGDAEILFFTGVRYHRFEDGELPARVVTRSRRRGECETFSEDDALRPDHQA